eukprot:COSAG04_NODE_185_length_21024_cov_49.557276_5_plen_334_part_00
MTAYIVSRTGTEDQAQFSVVESFALKVHKWKKGHHKVQAAATEKLAQYGLRWEDLQQLYIAVFDAEAARCTAWPDGSAPQHMVCGAAANARLAGAVSTPYLTTFHPCNVPFYRASHERMEEYIAAADACFPGVDHAPLAELCYSDGGRISHEEWQRNVASLHIPYSISFNRLPRQRVHTHSSHCCRFVPQADGKYFLSRSGGGGGSWVPAFSSDPTSNSYAPNMKNYKGWSSDAASDMRRYLPNMKFYNPVRILYHVLLALDPSTHSRSRRYFVAVRGRCWHRRSGQHSCKHLHRQHPKGCRQWPDRHRARGPRGARLHGPGGCNAHRVRGYA